MTKDTNTTSGAADLRAEVAMIDAAMVEMTNITPPLKRSECARLIRAALAAAGQATAAQQGVAYAALPDDREAFKTYLKECDECAIVPDVAGAFNAAWQIASHGQAPASTSGDFIRRTNEDYAAWCATKYTPEFNSKGPDLHGLWAWQEQQRRMDDLLRQAPIDPNCKSEQKRLATLWGFVPAQAAPAAVAGPSDPSITLDFKMASKLLDMFGGEPGLVTLQHGGEKCHSGAGLYAWYSDLPEEGAVFLGAEPDDEAAPTAQPAPKPNQSQKPMAGHEQARAIREGNEIAASDEYFAARPQIVSADRRKVFRAGFERGWDAARAAQEGKTHE